MNLEIKIVTKDNKVVTLKELFEGKEMARIKQAELPFEEKIKALVLLQRLAYTWGNRKDIVIWGV